MRKIIQLNNKVLGPYDTIVEVDGQFEKEYHTKTGSWATIIPHSVISDKNPKIVEVEDTYENPKIVERRKMFEIENHNTIAKANREKAYAEEADPLFFQVQRGDIDNQVWLDKIQEIKDRYPFAEETE